MEKDNQIAALPPAVQELVHNLAGFPGVGKKTALRMALYVMRNPRTFAEGLAESLLGVKDRVKFCTTCWTLSESDPCPICSDARRNHSIICVVEEAGDILAFERTGGWRGTYHVLGGAIAPLDGIGPETLRMEELRRRASAGVSEVVVATNATSEGETTALYISRMLKPLGVKVTRIARGIPVGSDIELVDDNTLQASLKGRSEIGG